MERQIQVTRENKTCTTMSAFLLMKSVILMFSTRDLSRFQSTLSINTLLIKGGIQCLYLPDETYKACSILFANSTTEEKPQGAQQELDPARRHNCCVGSVQHHVRCSVARHRFCRPTTLCVCHAKKQVVCGLIP